MRILLIISVLLSSFAFGQNFKASTFHVNAGVSWPDISPINTLLQHPDSCTGSICYPTFRNNLFSFGFGAEGVNGNLVWQADAYIYAISNPGARADLFRLNILQYYYGTFRLGYAALGKKTGDYPYLLYPYVGAGGGFGQLRLSNDGTNDFDRFNTSGIILDAGIALNTYNELRGTDGQWLKFGGSIGYYVAPASQWSLDDVTPTGPVPISPQGVYVRLTMGIGSVRNK
ncbi:MAG: hypothetical protein AB8F95_04010 [Bacteroidia bacterium]